MSARNSAHKQDAVTDTARITAQPVRFKTYNCRSSLGISCLARARLPRFFNTAR